MMIAAAPRSAGSFPEQGIKLKVHETRDTRKQAEYESG